MANFYREPPPCERWEFDFDYENGPDEIMQCRAYSDDDGVFYLVGVWTGQCFLDGDLLKGSWWGAKLVKAALEAEERNNRDARDDAAIARYQQREAA